MSPLMKDAGGNFYVSNIGKVPLYLEAQRYYI
jgi:hypothetical protein